MSEFLSELADDGLAVSGPGEPPLEGTWFWMEDAQRRSVISSALANPKQGITFLSFELGQCATTMRWVSMIRAGRH